jgi:hypothetical protein
MWPFVPVQHVAILNRIYSYRRLFSVSLAAFFFHALTALSRTSSSRDRCPRGLGLLRSGGFPKMSGSVFGKVKLPFC